jgi:hypothetical protein
MEIKSSTLEKVAVPISETETEDRVKVTEVLEETRSQLYSEAQIDQTILNLQGKIAKLQEMKKKFSE